jgi:pimeloyl-ACP methyl ester carboxylesterase
MNKSVRFRSLAIVIALLLPLVVMELQNPVTQPTVWFVYADDQDPNANLAAITVTHELTATGCNIKETVLSKMNSIPLYIDTIVIIGHGQIEGLETSYGILPWSDLYDMTKSRKPQHTVVLACHSPSIVRANIFGFGGVIDAEAGAIIAAWYISQALGLNSQTGISYERVLTTQVALKHPLSRVVYFVHGYFGDSSDFLDMAYSIETALGNNITDWYTYSYFDAYGATTVEEKNQVHGLTISHYATDFANYLANTHEWGTQINIVAHSMGGLIVREMLHLHRDGLSAMGIDFGSIITLGTPNLGTMMADTTNLLALLTATIPWILHGEYWASPVFYSMHPISTFMTSLNQDPMSYSQYMRWYTVAGISQLWSNLFWWVHGEPSDPLVGVSSAKLYFARSSPTFDQLDHDQLIKNSTIFDDVAIWLEDCDDSDGDGLSDDVEKYVYNTNHNDWDSDDDTLSDADEIEYGTDPWDSDSDLDSIPDGVEVHVYGTTPTAWSSDADILSDWQEIEWGYDPMDSTDPIPAEDLVVTAWQTSGTTGHVRANHYSAMDYVKVYAKYKTSSGYWTAYFYSGTDYTPYYYGDYYVSWTVLPNYVQMRVRVEAYDNAGHYLGSDYYYVTLPGSGGGNPGGDPVPE